MTTFLVRLYPRHVYLSALIVSVGLLSALPAFAYAIPGALPETLTLRAGEATLEIPADKVAAWLVLEHGARYAPEYQSQIEHPNLCPLPSPLQCALLLTVTERSHIQAVAQFSLDQTQLEQTLAPLAEQVDTPAEEARFTLTGEKVSAFSLGREGRRLDQTGAANAIAAALADYTEGLLMVELPVQTIAPSITESESNHLGIVSLIGEGRTNFKGSPKNRIHNFKRAGEQFHGLLIKPGEEFSFVEHLGPVDGAHGYLPELVIKHNKTTPEFGGGICQVSTTMFRAAIYSGLKITERRNHAYPVQYYKPYGFDATIYIPKPDLSFTNNTPGYILIQLAIEGEDMVFRFYGTPDGRQTSLDGPHILSRGAGGSMKTVFGQKVTDKDGNTVINDSFHSSYASPNKYPHPGQEPVFTSKPKDWSDKQWREYKQAHGL